jgi:hypothetical protein
MPKTIPSKSYTRNLDLGSGSALNQCGFATMVHMVREKSYYVKLFYKTAPFCSFIVALKAAEEFLNVPIMPLSLHCFQ